MARIVLHIDRLVLKGLQATDAAAISTGLQQGLQARLADPEARATLAAQSPSGVLKVGNVQIEQGKDSSGIGTALAKRITGGGRR